MVKDRLTALSAVHDWLVAVTHRQAIGYYCWVITPEMGVLTDGEVYPDYGEALAMGQSLVDASTGQPIDFNVRLY